MHFIQTETWLLHRTIFKTADQDVWFILGIVCLVILYGVGVTWSHFRILSVIGALPHCKSVHLWERQEFQEHESKESSISPSKEVDLVIV